MHSASTCVEARRGTKHAPTPGTWGETRSSCLQTLFCDIASSGTRPHWHGFPVRAHATARRKMGSGLGNRFATQDGMMKLQKVQATLASTKMN